MYFCNMIFRHLLNMRSHPTWVRGLKHCNLAKKQAAQWSHPTWVRGLKHNESEPHRRSRNVAPYVGAWIETRALRALLCGSRCRTLRGCVD